MSYVPSAVWSLAEIAPRNCHQEEEVALGVLALREEVARRHTPVQAFFKDPGGSRGTPKKEVKKFTPKRGQIILFNFFQVGDPPRAGGYQP